MSSAMDFDMNSSENAFAFGASLFASINHLSAGIFRLPFEHVQLLLSLLIVSATHDKRKDTDERLQVTQNLRAEIS